MTHTHHAGCGCLAALSRRNLLGFGLGATAIAAAGPALAAGDAYEAMLMKCIDPRFTSYVWKYMSSRGWENQYSQFNDDQLHCIVNSSHIRISHIERKHII